MESSDGVSGSYYTGVDMEELPGVPLAPIEEALLVPAVAPLESPLLLLFLERVSVFASAINRHPVPLAECSIDLSTSTFQWHEIIESPNGIQDDHNHCVDVVTAVA